MLLEQLLQSRDASLDFALLHRLFPLFVLEFLRSFVILEVEVSPLDATVQVGEFGLVLPLEVIEFVSDVGHVSIDGPVVGLDLLQENIRSHFLALGRAEVGVEEGEVVVIFLGFVLATLIVIEGGPEQILLCGAEVKERTKEQKIDQFHLNYNVQIT